MQIKAPSTGLDPDAFKDLYSYVESGFPVLASLRVPPGVGHVVSLVGHTIDYGKAMPGASEFIDSSHFLKQFVVVDDNCFPYRTLGYEDDLENYAVMYEKNGEKAGINNIVTMTCPLPEKVFVPAEDAREKAFRHCQKFLSTLKQTGSAPFVTRLFVTNSSAFKRRKLDQAKRQKDRAASVVVNLHLPHFIWVMEVAPLDAYKNRLCTAEIVLDATAGSSEEGMIYLRIGKQVHFACKTTTAWSRIEDAPIQFAQYTHNLGEIELA